MLEDGTPLPADVLCPICCDLFLDPTTLPCGHTFSKDGLERHIATMKREEKRFACPTCRAYFDRKSIAPNFLAQKMAAKYA